jgi:hypothetical protein
VARDSFALVMCPARISMPCIQLLNKNGSFDFVSAISKHTIRQNGSEHVDLNLEGMHQEHKAVSEIGSNGSGHKCWVTLLGARSGGYNARVKRVVDP